MDCLNSSVIFSYLLNVAGKKFSFIKGIFQHLLVQVPSIFKIFACTKQSKLKVCSLTASKCVIFTNVFVVYNKKYVLYSKENVSKWNTIFAPQISQIGFYYVIKLQN